MAAAARQSSSSNNNKTSRTSISGSKRSFSSRGGGGYNNGGRGRGRGRGGRGGRGGGGGGSGGYTPGSSRSQQKRQKLHSFKQRRRPDTYPLVKTLLQHWEKLRSSKTSTEEKTDLVQLILDRSKGRVAELSKMHSSSRVVQSCLKFGSTQHRDQIVEELKPELVALAQSQYGHFLVKKILSMSEEGGGNRGLSKLTHRNLTTA